MRTVAFAILLALSVTGVAGAAEPAHDPDSVVREQLDKLGTKHEVDEDGDFKLTFNMQGNRIEMEASLTPGKDQF